MLVRTFWRPSEVAEAALVIETRHVEEPAALGDTAGNRNSVDSSINQRDPSFAIVARYHRDRASTSLSQQAARRALRGPRLAMRART